MSSRALALLLTAVLLTGCESGGSSSSPPPDGPSGSGLVTPTPSPTTKDTPAATAKVTPKLDSIAVLGHSGATGFMSDPRRPGLDARENSWATGSNPAVDSIYRRLLPGHPDLAGHHYNGAVDGSRVTDLAGQFDLMMTQVEVAPDVILIQTIDNDMRCDGTDASNQKPFGAALDDVLSSMEQQIPGVQFFLVSQWATVDHWATWARHIPTQVAANSGGGPCGVFTSAGRLRMAGVHSMQKIVDDYWSTLTRVCRRHDGCFTDGGAQKAFVPTDRDVGPDFNHLSIAGHRKFAALAWAAFPAAIKDRR